MTIGDNDGSDTTYEIIILPTIEEDKEVITFEDFDSDFNDEIITEDTLKAETEEKFCIGCEIEATITTFDDIEDEDFDSINEGSSTLW